MTTANITLFFVIVIATIAFCLYDFSSMPFKENLKVSLIFGTILGLIFYAGAFKYICETTATKDQIEWITVPSNKAKLTSYQSVNKHYKVVKTLDQVTTDDQHWSGKLTVNDKSYTYDDLKLDSQTPTKISYGTVYRPAKIFGHLFYKGDAKGHTLKLSD